MQETILYTDETLFERIAQGDESAFTEIFYRYTTRLFPFVAKLINSDSWAEEIVQDVFLRLWQGREKLSQVDNPSAYLYQMASNRTMDYIKRNLREVKLQYYIARQQAAQDPNLTAQDLDFREADAMLKEAVNNLPAQRRKVYQMGREEGLSHEEIAERLQISKHTVRNHMAEALREIREYLQANGAFTALVLYTIKNFW